VPKNLIELEERSVAHREHRQSVVIKRAQGAYPHVRRTLFWCHFAVGLTIGLIVAFLAITGSIMAFQDRVIAFAERRVQVQLARETPCISVEAGLEAIRAQTGQTPATVQVFANGARPSLMTLPRNLSGGCLRRTRAITRLTLEKVLRERRELAPLAGTFSRQA
jgi:hypothetical protein